MQRKQFQNKTQQYNLAIGQHLQQNGECAKNYNNKQFMQSQLDVSALRIRSNIHKVLNQFYDSKNVFLFSLIMKLTD